MLSVMGVSYYIILYLFIFFLAKIRLCTEKDRVPAPPLLSSAVVLRDQDRTIATLKDTAGVPFSLCATYQRLLLNRPHAKANFCNHELSVASKRVQGWIHLVSSNKDGAASRGAMMMTIELRMSEKHCLHKHVGKSRHCVDITVIFSALALEDSVIPSLQASMGEWIFLSVYSACRFKKIICISILQHITKTKTQLSKYCSVNLPNPASPEPDRLLLANKCMRCKSAG